MTAAPLPRGVDGQLRSLERVSASGRDPSAALRETVAAIWQVVERAAAESALDASRSDALALLARRELVERETGKLAAVIRGGVDSGAFRPGCASWAIGRLPFAIVAAACGPWVFGLATAPSLRASVAVEAALDVLRPRSQRSLSVTPIVRPSRDHRASASAPLRVPASR